MSDFRNLVCDDEARRALLEADPSIQGIDYIEVVTAPLKDNQFVLEIYFIPKTKQAGKDSLSMMLAALDSDVGKIAIQGGVRTRNIRVTKVKRKGNHLTVRVDEPGDFSNYTLVIDKAALDQPGHFELDPAYMQCDFNFKAGCPSRFDCKPRLICPPEPRVEPIIDYMAKDYASFRQALIDLIPTLVPDWKERHEADLGIALIELLAYAGDQLSYYQDAVSNEVYLQTARQRISIRRHAHLIDYHMHDGTSARVFVHVKVNSAGPFPLGTRVLTRIDVPLGAKMPPHGPVIDPTVEDQALDAADVAFETMTSAQLHPNLNEIVIHSWGNLECCLPRGVTSLDLVGDLAFDPGLDLPNGTRKEEWRLKPGDFLLFEEVKGPETGLAADADLFHRQVVRLKNVENAGTRDPLVKDPNTGQPLKLTRVTWADDDALSFPLCISSRNADGQLFTDVTVARGNISLADHGRSIFEWYPGDPADARIPGNLVDKQTYDKVWQGVLGDPADPQLPGIEVRQRAYRFRLQKNPLSFRIPLPEENGSFFAAKELTKVDPRDALPQVSVRTISSDKSWADWTPVTPHLLDSDSFSQDFVAETDNDGFALIRFGDDQFGMAPPNGAHITATYRVGVGTAGNVGAESLVHVLSKPNPTTTEMLPAIERVRNPLPAWGGLDPQPIAQVKQLAPAEFHAEQFRAVTEADYARKAEKQPEVSHAAATFRWTGSWHTVFVTVDPKNRTDVSHEMQQRLLAWVTRFTQAGYDLEVNRPIFVPLDIEVKVCVGPNHFRGDVEEAVLTTLSSRALPDGTQGFFSPDNFTFGQPLYLSRLYAAIEAVEGVDSTVVTKFQRYAKAANDELEQGRITMGRLEVVRLDNDSNFPENGTLRLKMLGGK